MKKKVLSCFLAVVMVFTFVGCNDSKAGDSSEQSDNYTKKVEIDNVTFYIPEDSIEAENSSADNKEYNTSFGMIKIMTVGELVADWHDTSIMPLSIKI